MGKSILSYCNIWDLKVFTRTKTFVSVLGPFLMLLQL